MIPSERSARPDGLVPGSAADSRAEPLGGADLDLRLRSMDRKSQRTGAAPGSSKLPPAAAKQPAPSRRAKGPVAKQKGRTFGEVIRERRRQLDLTQEETARQIKSSVPYIGHLESNSRHPSEAVVARLADALGLDRSELFFLANPEAKALLQQQRPGERSPWEEFRSDERLQRAYGLTQTELDVLSRIALMGEVRSVRDFIYIINTIRQALSK